MADPELSAEVARDRQAALELGIDESPMSFVNGRPLPPVRFVDDAAVLVEEEIRRAEGLVAAGTGIGEIHAKVVEGGKPRLPGGRRAVRKVLDPQAVYRVPVLDDDPVRGGADPLLTVVFFGDFECPYSARAAAALAGLRRELGKEVRVVFKHLPLPSHPTAALAAEAAVEAQRQGRFWEMHDGLFESFRELSREKLVEIGEGVGLDRSELTAALDERTHAGRVERDRALAAELELHGVPHLLLNGMRVRGSRSVDQLLTLAGPLLEEAERKRREAGVAGSDAGAGLLLYDRLIASGATAPVYLEPGATLRDPDVVTDGEYRVYEVVVPDDAPVLGPRTAPVTVVEFGDYQCGWCRRAYPVLKDLRKSFGDDVRVIFMHFPIAGHEHARLAAEAAVEAQLQGKFWKFHEKLLESHGALAQEDLIDHAGEAGLDTERMRRALETRAHRDRVRSDVRAARELGVAGTPAFFVNGRKGSATRFDRELPALVARVLAQRKTTERP
jgi:protein-disulfide isomerase